MKTLTLYEENIGKGNLILVNPSHPMRCEPKGEDLAPVRPDYPEIFLEKQTTKMLTRVIDDLNCDCQIVPVSGYRTIHEQKQIYVDSVRDSGTEFTQKFVAIPGCSEHQTGLAIDLAENKPNIDFIRPDFPCTGICQSFRERCVRYGFIERYQAGCEFITQIAQEPWHFRYVGYPHSELMKKEGLTLEEYTDYIKCFPYDSSHLRLNLNGREIEVFYVCVPEDKPASVEIPDMVPYQVSGNNEDGFVVTLWGGLL